MSETARTVVPIRGMPAGPDPTRNARAHAREEQPPQPPKTTITDSDERVGLVARLVDELVPPAPLTHRPECPADLVRYAREGAWTAPEGAPRMEGGPATRPFSRNVGVAWTYVISIPTTVVLAYLMWVAARPSRQLVVGTLALLAWLTWM